MTSRIVALDPGGTTGWSTITINDDDVLSFNHGMLQRQQHHQQLYKLLEDLQVGVNDYEIVCESFEYRNASRPGLELVSVEYIGVMKLFCQERNIQFHMQSASQGKVRDKPTAFVKSENLKRLGLWSPSQVHAMDAYGHLLYYLINSKVYPEIALELLNKGWKV